MDRSCVCTLESKNSIVRSCNNYHRSLLVRGTRRRAEVARLNSSRCRTHGSVFGPVHSHLCVLHAVAPWHGLAAPFGRCSLAGGRRPRWGRLMLGCRSWRQSPAVACRRRGNEAKLWPPPRFHPGTSGYRRSRYFGPGVRGCPIGAIFGANSSQDVSGMPTSPETITGEFWL